MMSASDLAALDTGGFCAPIQAGTSWHVVGAAGEVRAVTGEETRTAAMALAGPIARLLAHDGVVDGRTVVLALADSVSFLAAFFGVGAAGAVPAPAPGNVGRHRVHVRRIAGMVRGSRAPMVITSAPVVGLLRRELAGLPVRIAAVEELAAAAVPAPPPSVDWSGPEWPAYVQYTSGSTADPAPVLVRRRHLHAQLRQAAMVFEESPDSVSVTWVPLHHDMGLVTGVLRPAWSGYPSVLLDPFDFVRRPRHWLEQMTHWSATHTSAPDFGYALCAAKVTDVAGLDLRTLRVARNAGEMVRGSTLDAFAQRFAEAGFRRSTFAPSYGLAEATLTVTACPPGQAPREFEVSRIGLSRGRVLLPSGEGDVERLVSCGPALPDTSVRILPWVEVDAATSEDRPPPTGATGDLVGEVWISGPQVVEGGPQHMVDGQPGRRTGDLGFIRDGELVLLGRARDRFQMHGSNYYSTELEAAVARCCSDVRPGRVVVFACPTDGPAGHSEVVVLAERRDTSDPLPLAGPAQAAHVRRVLRQEFGLSIHHVGWLPPRTLPVTTSGKLRRDTARELYLTGALPVIDGNDDDR